ncbi:hypothetical protein CcrColossus_gp336 [Caulobacter phage CcrColossus]|uniref:Uncharacterized protein n=1 Tax=Caulobacter phage CcrColossus TaxID=1211640 RepID=K4JSU1_9CAUD|nr:hypothetical protein CcrColossus_gp336 [Caulobacter phage CcrColossus]AFU88206.1 hypothetical protein CcrColossus_gp336 [Caulobacter phage CcrColossus]
MVSSSLMCPSRSNPFDGDDGVTKLQDDVLGLLEDAGLPTDINDQIMLLVQTGEGILAGERKSAEPRALEEARDAVQFYDRVQRASADEKIAVGHDHWDRLIKAIRGVVSLLPGERFIDPVSGAIPEGVYWFAEHQNFYDANTRVGMGDTFYRNWRGRYHEFPTEPG